MKYNVIHSAESSKYVDIYYVQQEVTASEINAAVYAVLCYVAEEVLKRSTCYISGERTAAELAGTVENWIPIAPLSENGNLIQMAPEVQVRAGTWKCNFPTIAIFTMMAEWEGVMGLTAKQTYRFQCETKKDMPKGMELKAYRRWRVYRPKRISFAYEEKRIAQKFEVIGKMAQDLSDEGMKKAMSVLAAAKAWNKEPALYQLALKVMRKKLWSDYGKDEYAQPIVFTEKDFEHGPELWKQVNEDYVKVLVEHFKQMMPVPTWVKDGDYVQYKNQEKVTKMYQGKLYVETVFAHVDTCGDRIEWFASLHLSGRYTTRPLVNVNVLEPWVEPEKPKKKATEKKDAKVVVKQIAQPKQTAPLSIADRLRAALRARLAA